MRSALCLAGAALLAMALLPAGPAASQGILNKILPGLGKDGSPDAWKVCEGQDGAALDKRIEACTVVIDSGLETDTILAGAYTNRGSALAAEWPDDEPVLDRGRRPVLQRGAPQLSRARIGRPALRGACGPGA